MIKKLIICFTIVFRFESLIRTALATCLTYLSKLWKNPYKHIHYLTHQTPDTTTVLEPYANPPKANSGPKKPQRLKN